MIDTRRVWAVASTGFWIMIHKLSTLVASCLVTLGSMATANDSASNVPEPPREFRAAWIATVANIDWPSKPGLPASQQKREMIALLDAAVELNLNAVIFHVRPSADALYASKLEPWSEYLSGRMGQPPDEYYDPLEFAIQEAHRRGLQLHAWFNPFRVRTEDAKTEASLDHISRTHPELVRTYGKYLWLDPGEPAAVDQFVAVVRDVVTRYDVDGVHIDDYFYPYPIKDEAKKDVPFPDDDSYARAVAAGEKLDRDDWRRQNIDRLIERMYREVKEVKPWVLVGISPFGIWRPGSPEGIVGFDPYVSLYADSRKWLAQGWLDYISPQLYWKVDSPGQSYPKLLAWWAEQNSRGRHLWPGNFTSRIGQRREGKTAGADAWTADEIIRQIDVTRAQKGATGNIHFSMKALVENRGGIAEALKAGPYAEPALVPESTWLGGAPPGQFILATKREGDGVKVAMNFKSREFPWQWVVRLRTDAGWQTAIVPGPIASHTFSVAAGEKPLEVAASAVSRLGREGPLVRTPIDGAR